MQSSDEKQIEKLFLLKRFCFIFSGLIATVIICAWLMPAFSRTLPDSWSLMKANTALAVLFSIATLHLQEQEKIRKFASDFCALIVMLLACTALAGHLSGQFYGLETMLADDSGAEMPGRMSIQSALFFILIASIRLIDNRHRPSLVPASDTLCILLLLLIMVLFAGYMFGAAKLFGQSPYTRTSPQTLACMFMLSTAAVITRIRSGLFALYAINGIGSYMVKSVLPFVLLLPFLVVGFSTYMMAAGLLTPPYSVALTASTSSILLFLAVTLMAKKINDAMESLSATEAQVRLLLNSAGEGIFGLDSDGNTTFVNPAACRLLGFERSELLGRPMHELTHHHHSDGTNYPDEQCPISAALTDGKIHRAGDEVFWRKDGTHFPVEYTSTPVMNDDEIIGAVVIFADITERQKIARMKDEFISTVSHELRTPLTSIKGSLGLLVGGKLGDIPQTAVQMLMIAYDNSTRLEGLINDLLDINKIQLSDTALKITRLQANELIDKTLNSIQGYADKFGIRCLWQAVEQHNACIMGDENRLIQVLSNLLSNAIKYSNAGADVTISTDRSDNEIRIYITDTGAGIPIDYQDKVFEKFTQADSSDTRQKGGTGLGLAITKEIVEKHGGRIGFASMPEQGTTFYIGLPVAER